jgi:hypothetical protein
MGWLDSNKIAYKKVATDEDKAGMMEFMKVSDGMIGVPFTVIKEADGNITKISDYNQGKFKQALSL